LIPGVDTPRYTLSPLAHLDLDPPRFHQADEVDPEQVQAVMIRRLKEDLRQGDASRRSFPHRRVRALTVPADPAAGRAAEILDRYIRHRLERAEASREALPIRFALILLKKRFLSSPLAFRRSLETHLEHVTQARRGELRGRLDRIRKQIRGTNPDQLRLELLPPGGGEG